MHKVEEVLDVDDIVDEVSLNSMSMLFQQITPFDHSHEAVKVHDVLSRNRYYT